MKKWFVFDLYDCFSEHATAIGAAETAQAMADEGLDGVEIRHFTPAEFRAYCASSTALASLRETSND